MRAVQRVGGLAVAFMAIGLILSAAGCPTSRGGGNANGNRNRNSNSNANANINDNASSNVNMGTNENANGSPACGEPANFSGTWRSDFECTSSCGDNFSERILLVVTQNGEDADYTDPDGSRFPGTVCGNLFAWSGTGDGFTESGTWTLTAEDTISKTSHYRSADPPNCEGDCTGNLVRE